MSLKKKLEEKNYKVLGWNIEIEYPTNKQLLKAVMPLLREILDGFDNPHKDEYWQVGNTDWFLDYIDKLLKEEKKEK